MSPLARALRDIRPTVPLFVGLLMGVQAVVKPFTTVILFGAARATAA